MTHIGRYTQYGEVGDAMVAREVAQKVFANTGGEKIFKQQFNEGGKIVTIYRSKAFVLKNLLTPDRSTFVYPYQIGTDHAWIDHEYTGNRVCVHNDKSGGHQWRSGNTPEEALDFMAGVEEFVAKGLTPAAALEAAYQRWLTE